MLSFELKPASDLEAPEELEIWLDQEGLLTLQSGLEFLANGETEHIHLMAKSWGGNMLDDIPQSTSGISIKHVKILLRRQGG